MKEIWTTDHIRAAEQALSAIVDEASLMRKAAFGVAQSAVRLLKEQTNGVFGRQVVLLVGAGSNGGDALWSGFFLRRRGVGVTAVLLNPERAHTKGLAALSRSGGRVVSADEGPQWIKQAHLVVDGVVGISSRGSLREDAAKLIEHCEAPILSVDLPSGVDPDTGTVSGPAVRATRTITFGARKPVHVLNPDFCGQIELVDIGLGLELGEPDLFQLEASDVARLWPIPGVGDDKYTQGVTGVAAGSAMYPGAAVLVTGAAVSATSGMVRYAGPAAEAVQTRWPETITTGSVADAGRVQAWVVGPGLGIGRESVETLRGVLASGVPVCVDADAITMIANSPEILDARDPGTPLVLTPHDREFARLTGEEPGRDRVAAAREAARRFNAVLLLKGHATIVAAPDGRVLVNEPRGSWLATAGSGDVLSGVIGALLAVSLDPWRAAAAGAYLHSVAAEIAADGAPISASKLVDAIPEAVRRVRAGRVERV